MIKHISELSVDELEQILEIKKNIKIYQDQLNELLEDKPQEQTKRYYKPRRKPMSTEARNKIRKARLKQIRKWRKEGKNSLGRPVDKPMGTNSRRYVETY